LNVEISLKKTGVPVKNLNCNINFREINKKCIFANTKM